MIAGFEVLSKIGQGGMGAVLKARQVSLDRIVALKILPPKIAMKDPVFVERFFREARVSAKLNHPNIVQGIEVGQDEASGLYYFAMEYIDGPTLRQIMKAEGVLQERRALQIIGCIASALASANKAGIVHRDIKPDNILLTSRGEPKLADLGLAKRMTDSDGAEATPEGANPASGPAIDASLTQAGSAMGTPYYMAPEQVTGVGQMDIRTDLYALGATLFHLVTGKTPFSGKNSAEIMQARLKAEAPDARSISPELSEATAGVMRKLMQKDPAKRFQTPEELEKKIAEILKELDEAPAGARRERKKPAMTGNRAGAASGERRGTGTGRNELATGGGQTMTYAAAAGAVVVLGVLVYMYGRGSSAPQQPMPAKIETAVSKTATDTATVAKTEIPALPKAAPLKTDAPPTEAKAESKGEPSKLAPDVPAKAAPESAPAKTPAASPVENAPPGTANPSEAQAVESKPADVATSSKPAESTAKAEPPPSAAPQPNADAATRQELDKLMMVYATMMSVGSDKDAGALLATALHKPEFASVTAAIQAEQKRNAWPADLEKAIAAGAAKLSDNRPFKLGTKDGKIQEVGGNSKQKITKLKGDVLEGELVDQGVTMGLRFKLSTLSDATRRELSLLSVEGNKAAAMDLEVKWIYPELLGCAVNPTPARLTALDTRIEILRIDGIAPDVLQGIQQWQHSIREKMEISLKEKSEKAAEEKRKRDEKRAAQNFYCKANEGDWVSYKHTDGIKFEVKVLVIKKDDKAVVIGHEHPFTSADVNRKEETVNLSEPYTVRDLLYFSPDAKKTDEGEETLTINGKSYKCKREFWWDAFCRNPKNKAEYVEVEHQIWYCPDAPMSGLVKYQMKWIKSHDPRQHPYEGLYGCLMELSDSGAGK
jgi:hypothetical protein